MAALKSGKRMKDEAELRRVEMKRGGRDGWGED
jgi:hypothetical protein